MRASENPNVSLKSETLWRPEGILGLFWFICGLYQQLFLACAIDTYSSCGWGVRHVDCRAEKSQWPLYNWRHPSKCPWARHSRGFYFLLMSGCDFVYDCRRAIIWIHTYRTWNELEILLRFDEDNTDNLFILIRLGGKDSGMKGRSDQRSVGLRGAALAALALIVKLICLFIHF